MNDPLLTPAQVAKWTGYSTTGLAQLRHRGQGPKFIKLTARAVRYRQSEVEAWLDAQTRTCTEGGDAA